MVLKRGFNGVCYNQGRKHCCLYANKFASRLNEGDCRHYMSSGLNDPFRTIVGKAITYRELVA